MKRYKIEFYELTIDTPTANCPDAFTALASLANGNRELSISIGGIVRELWPQTLWQDQDVIKGSFRKFRMNDLPEIGRVGDTSRELLLEENQGLVEKNFFALYRQQSLLIWHSNGHANTPTQFGHALGELLGTRVNVNPLIQSDALRRLMRGDVKVRKIEVSIPRPKNPDYYPRNEFNRALFSAMSAADGDRIRVSISSNGMLKPQSKFTQLKNTVKQALDELVTDSVVSVARADVKEDDGIEHPIDLIADRLLSFQGIDHDGRYPLAQEMFKAFDEARSEKQEEIDACLGKASGRKLH